MIKNIADLKIKIFADGADKLNILELANKPHIGGFTTNPTLMAKAGIIDYEIFARDILSAIKDKPISFEVFSDEFSEMESQARFISSWGSNVYVKVPITNTRKESSFELIKKLSSQGIKLNITAVLSLEQINSIIPALSHDVPTIISVFAGRVADTGRDPVPLMKEAKNILSSFSNVELLWASPRELLNIFQADEVGSDIITVTPDILKKLEKVGYGLEDLSLDTVKMFYDDGRKAGYKFNINNKFSDYIDVYLREVGELSKSIDKQSILKTIEALSELRKNGGRLFVLGIGGSAANASHAVNDFRKICKMEVYAPTDNVSELTAWTNDNGFEFIFSKWLETSKLNSKDALMIFSVGGGSETTSRNLVLAMEYAKSVGAKIFGIVSRDGGMTKKLADVTLLVPVVSKDRITPHAEEWQGVLWHLMANALGSY